MSTQKVLKEKFNDLVGELKIRSVNNMVLLSGNVFVSDKDEFSKELMKQIGDKYPSALLSNNLKINEFVVVEDEVDTNVEHEKVLDEVNVLYYGYLFHQHLLNRQYQCH